MAARTFLGLRGPRALNSTRIVETKLSLSGAMVILHTIFHGERFLRHMTLAGAAIPFPSGTKSLVERQFRLPVELIPIPSDPCPKVLLIDPSKVVLTRSALPLDGKAGGLPEYIIPKGLDNGAIRVDRVSGVNPEF
jgi:hypothetical protein